MSTRGASAVVAAASFSASSSVGAVKTMKGAGVAQFTGSYLNRAWTRRFILGALLQKYNPAVTTSSSTASASSSATGIDVAVLNAQRRLSERWLLPAKPLDATSESRIMRVLARYACGEGLLSDESLGEFTDALSFLPGSPLPLEDPRNMERLLTMLGYAQRGDNLRRVAYAGSLSFSAQAESFMEPFLQDSLQQPGGDVFDAIRVHHSGPAYAIDSATTSEVDDAIGVEVDPATGEQLFVVYVSDATVYCPFDSQLEQTTARALVTTTYLPEGVYFMLPKPIVEAATLREDRPCRTLCIRFQIDDATGELKNYSVHVGWLDQLRRITYDQVQRLLVSTPQASAAREEEGKIEEEAAEAGKDAACRPPSWLTDADTRVLRYIYAAAQRRFHARMQRAVDHQQVAISGSLPDPLIKVRGTRVTSLTDQIVSTQDARLAVAELMIAANEVCSRIAQAEQLPIPFRGTRPLSSDHEAAKLFCEPAGATVMATLDGSHTFLAEGMQHAVRQLSGVTRAMYAHQPMYHAGLDTTFYTHSTSPLRRYADMLVHHQLKVWLWRQHGGGSCRVSGVRKNSMHTPLSFPGLPVPAYVMSTLCANISTRQEQAALLQDGSSRFWTLTYIAQQLQEYRSRVKGNASDGMGAGKEKHYLCLVGETKRIAASPEYPHGGVTADEAVNALLSHGGVHGNSLRTRRRTSPPAYVSEVYIPELQVAHRVFHDRRDVVVGAVVICRVVTVRPTQDVLELAVVSVRPNSDERGQLEKLWLSGVVSRLDS